MAYLSFHFTVEPPQPGSEILMAMIADMGFESFDDTETGFTAYIKEEESKNVKLDDLRFDEFKYSYVIKKHDDVNWNAEWERNFEPVQVDNLLCIRAPFHEKCTGVEHEIVIMPKMSFGTGHHQTTRLMCRQMFEIDLKGKRVLDMGCGTAVLAILAKKLHAGEVVGVDIDQWCVENSKENCISNNFADIEVELGDIEIISSWQPFDVILANINKNILKSHLPVYSQKLMKDGILFLSGFFKTDVDELKRESEKLGFHFQSSHSEDEWAMMRLVKK